MKMVWGVVWAAVAMGGEALAQAPESSERLQARAQAAFEQGRPREALDLARRAAAIRVEPRLLRFMAVMHYELGELPEAVDDADRCILASHASEDPADRTDTLGVCRRIVDELGGQVAWLVVRAPPARSPAVRIAVRGAALPSARWNVPVPVPPGVVVVEAREGDRVVLRRELTLAAGARGAVDVPASQGTPPPPRTVSPSPAPWIVAGAGAAVFIAGNRVVLGRDGAVEARDAACPGAACDGEAAQRARGHDDDARAWQTAGYVLFGVGAVALVGGVVWGVVDLRRARARGASLAPVFRASERGVALGLGGSF